MSLCSPHPERSGDGRSQARIDGFIDQYRPQRAALTRTLVDQMKARLPGAVVMVYDNCSALVFGYGATEKPSRRAVVPRVP